MTWASYIATGNGSLAFRVDIAGLPAQFVGMSAAAASFGTQARVLGLRMQGQKLSQRADLARATLEAGAIRVTVVDVDQIPTSYLAKVGHPTATTWLSLNLTAAGTTVTVSSTTDFVSTNGYIWIDGECISYTGVTGTTFTGCTRGVFNTLAQAHYIADGASLRYPAVTNQPITLEGQRVRLYAYGEQDDTTGAGTLIHTGVVTSDPRYNGVVWEIGVDSLARLLSQKLGAADATITTPRGIYYPSTAPFAMRLRKCATSTLDSGGTTVMISFPRSASDSAFFETQQLFCEYVNEKIAASDAAAWETKFRAAVSDDGSWHMEITTDPSTPLAGSAEIVHLFADPVGGGINHIDELVAEPVRRETGVLIQPFVAGTTYIQQQVPGFGTPVRSVFIGGTSPLMRPDIAATYAQWPDGRIYTAGAVAPPTGTRVVLIDGHVQPWPYTITAGRIDFAVPVARSSIGRSVSFGGQVLTYMVVHTLQGGAGDFLDSLIAAAPTDLCLGAGPDLRSGDVATGGFKFYGDGSPDWLVNRQFFGAPKKTIGDVLSAELQAAGQFLRLSAGGGLDVATLKPAIQSEASVASVTEILTKSMPRYEHSSRGLINTLVIEGPFDPDENEWRGPKLRIRDVAAFGRAPAAREVVIGRISVPYSGRADISYTEAVNIASRIFGVLGGSYSEVTVDVPLSYFDVNVGEVIRLTARNVPNTDGTIGISDRAGIVVGREHDLTAGILTLSVFIGGSSIAGYAPAAQIATETNVSGNIWDVTLADTEAPTGSTSASWFAAGDAIRVWLFDNTTPTVQTGDVTSVTGSTVRITLDGAATLGTGDWVLEYDAATAWAANPDPPFLFLATSAGRVSLPTSGPAWVFSP